MRDKNLTNITIPAFVLTIDEGAFKGCKNLTSIDIPKSVISIGNEAFRNCENLISVNIPNSVTSIGMSAFYVLMYECNVWRCRSSRIGLYCCKFPVDINLLDDKSNLVPFTFNNIRYIGVPSNNFFTLPILYLVS